MSTTQHIVLRMIANNEVPQAIVRVVAQAALDGASYTEVATIISNHDEQLRKARLNPMRDKHGDEIHEQIEERDDGRDLIMRCGDVLPFSCAVYTPDEWVNCPRCIARRIALHGKARP